MPKLNISKQIHINAPVDKVFAELNNFKNWPAWSPWLIAEPDAKLVYADDEKQYTWEGKRVGSGEMSITSESPNEYVNYDLNFLKPWKSQAKVRFDVAQEGNGTQVSWSMDSSLPFFMFFMKKMMTAMIGKDYERGLNMLKDYVEKGAVESKLNFIGEVEYPGCNYIGIKRNCRMDEMPKYMQADFGKIAEFISDKDDIHMNDAFSIYHKFDMVKEQVSYTAAVPVKKNAGDLPKEFITDSIPATKIYRLEHVGRYDHLGNAWSTIHAMHRSKEIKFKKGIHPFETYGNNPNETAPVDLSTFINFPIK